MGYLGEKGIKEVQKERKNHGIITWTEKIKRMAMEGGLVKFNSRHTEFDTIAGYPDRIIQLVLTQNWHSAKIQGVCVCVAGGEGWFESIPSIHFKEIW